LQGLQFVFGLIVVIFYVPLLFRLLRSFDEVRARRELVRALKSILDRVDDDEEAIEQLQVVFKKMAERYRYVRTHYKDPRGFVEEIMCRAEAMNAVRFRTGYGAEFTAPEVDRVARIVSLLKARQPFGAVSSKYGNLLEMISHAVETGNVDLGTSNLRQLADDIEVVEATLETQAKRNSLSITVSVVGVVLTLVFGALTVIQMLAQSPK